MTFFSRNNESLIILTHPKYNLYSISNQRPRLRKTFRELLNLKKVRKKEEKIRNFKTNYNNFISNNKKLKYKDLKI